MTCNVLMEFVSFKIDIHVPLRGVENKSVKHLQNGEAEKETSLNFESAI